VAVGGGPAGGDRLDGFRGLGSPEPVRARQRRLSPANSRYRTLVARPRNSPRLGTREEFLVRCVHVALAGLGVVGRVVVLTTRGIIGTGSDARGPPWRIAPILHAGLGPGERGVGYALLTSEFGSSIGPSLPGATFSRRARPGPVAMVWLMWHAAAGYVRNDEESRPTPSPETALRRPATDEHQAGRWDRHRGSGAADQDWSSAQAAGRRDSG